MTRQLFVIHHSLRNFIVSSVLSSIAIIINTTTDGIVVSQAVSTDAISVVSLVSPVLTIVQLFGSMLFSGAALIVATAYGDQQYRQVNQLVTMSLTAVLIFNGLLALVLSMFSGQIAHLLTNEERLLPLVEDYLPYSLAACVCWLLCDAVGRYVKISGRPRLVTNYVILNAALNLLLDLLLVIWMGMDMKGAALASMIAPVAAMVVYVPYLSTPSKPFTFNRIDRRDYVRLLGKSLVHGMPSAVGSLIMAFLYMALNYIVLHTEGADGMYILSVSIQTVTFGLILTFAANSAVKYIGGMMYGERDWDGLNRLLMSILKIVLAACMVVTILVYIYPTVVADIYGADDRLRQLSEKPIRLFVQSLVPLSILMLVSNIYMMSGRGKLSSIIQFGPLVIMLPVVWVISTVMPDYLWYSIPVGLWILLLITDGSIYVLLHKGEKLHWLFLTPTKTLYETYTVSICFDEDDARGKLQLLQDHISNLDLNNDLVINVWHSLKELTRHELDMGKETGRSGAFDVSLQNLQERFTIIIKDVGKAYNPPVSHQYCNDVNYQYLNGLNCLYLNFPKER
ncbi:MAG: hypothetical protein J5637_08715 [Prevotella sp.]|nr:hypothetical protein [Prevotella sp.]